jgi:glycosyl transferase family 1
MTSAALKEVFSAPPTVGRAHHLPPLRPMLVTFGSVLQPDGGLQVRSRVVAESLAVLGMPPAIVSTREPYTTDASPAWTRSLHVPARKPRKGYSREFVGLLRRVARDCDVVIVANAMFMPALAASGVTLPVVWDTNECQGLHYARLPASAGNIARRLVWSGLERWAARRCNVAVSIGEAEAQEWRRRYPTLRHKTATIDHVPLTSPIALAPDRASVAQLAGTGLPGPVLVFVGTMTAKHNVAAAQWLVDVLAPGLSDAVNIILCGPGSERFQSAGNGARVIGLGMVDNIDEVVASADLCLAPLASGAGVKTKVLHYLAQGQRVVGTRVAFEGLDDAPGLSSCPLPTLPDLVARMLASPETEHEAMLRRVAQFDWMNRHHARDRAVEQWREVLECLTRP